MPSPRIPVELNAEMYFLTCTVLDWQPIFSRHGRWDILLESLRHCQQFKGLSIFAWVFMLDHLHLIVKSRDVAGFVRDFKKHTARELMLSLYRTEPETAQRFELPEGKYRLWDNTNMPKLIKSEAFFLQKKAYIEHNPVRKEYVDEPQQWRYSPIGAGAPSTCQRTPAPAVEKERIESLNSFGRHHFV